MIEQNNHAGDTLSTEPGMLVRTVQFVNARLQCLDSGITLVTEAPLLDIHTYSLKNVRWSSEPHNRGGGPQPHTSPPFISAIQSL